MLQVTVAESKLLHVPADKRNLDVLVKELKRERDKHRSAEVC